MIFIFHLAKAKLNTYDRKSSATYKPVKGYEDSTFEQVYGTGTIYGIYASDQVQVRNFNIFYCNNKDVYSLMKRIKKSLYVIYKSNSKLYEYN